MMYVVVFLVKHFYSAIAWIENYSESWEKIKIYKKIEKRNTEKQDIRCRKVCLVIKILLLL
jgi:hypothetical protein